MGNVERLKTFYSTSDFFNYIKKPETTPSSHRLSSIVPLVNSTIKDNPRLSRIFTSTNLEKFSLLANDISNLPNFQMGGTENTEITVNTPEGGWKGMGNNNIMASSQTFTINFIDTVEPIIENFIYPWFLECINANSGGVYPFPRIDIIIRYFTDAEIKRINEPKNLGMEPKENFKYRITGCYPTAIDACTVNHRIDTDQDYIRKVTFTFNNMYIDKTNLSVASGSRASN